MTTASRDTPGRKEGRPQPAAIDATMAAYLDAGGPASIRGLASFSAYLGAAINNLHTQARVAIAADALEEHREMAHARVDLALRSLSSRALLQQVGDLAARRVP